MAVFRLTKQAKLIKTDDFSSVFNFRKRIATEHLVIHYLLTALPQARLGLVVSKKTAKLAVRRNYMRRLLRELFRLQQSSIGNIDIIIRVQKPFGKSDFMQIKLEFESLMAKLEQRIKRSSVVSESSFAAPGNIHPSC